MEIGNPKFNWKFKRLFKFNRNNNEKPIEIQLSFQWIPVEISMRDKLKLDNSKLGSTQQWTQRKWKGESGDSGDFGESDDSA